ncbi:hypothetical protein [Salinarchaeum sp. Harcht-Bsk1]|nr:hypothetical protein [Salinarchaeum sp. Harcht-Bsk1]
MCHHYEREQLTTTEPIGAEDVDEDRDDELDERTAEVPPAADD